MKVVSHFHFKELRWDLAPEDLARLGAKFPNVDFVSVEDPAKLHGELADADVFVGFGVPRDAFLAAKRLRWVQSVWAGIEENLFPEMVDSEVILTNGAGLHAVSIPEHVVGQMLVLARNFHEAMRLQAKHEWNRFGVIAFANTIQELNGSKLAILGAGAIGQNLARLGVALGQTVRVMRRDTSRRLPDVEEIVPPERLHELLAWADFVVVALPLTPATRGIIDERALAAMRPSSFLINVGRGEHIDEEALVHALQRGAIAGAALDAFNQEPLPSDHPFWSLPNLFLTPHISGYTPNYFGKALALFEDNLERYRAGRPLRNVVDKQAGYARN